MSDELNKKEEVNQKQLEETVGGSRWSTYESGETPLYKVGDIVYIDTYFGTFKCTVVGVSNKKAGWVFEEFQYSLRLDERMSMITVGDPGPEIPIDERQIYDEMWEHDLRTTRYPSTKN